MAQEKQSQGPLQGVRVLDFGRVLSAPYGTQVLADLGADVVKVEHPQKGDDTRSFGPPFVDGISTYFLSINRGKRSIAIDLKKQSHLARQLALAADVVVENFRPGVMQRLGLGAAELVAQKKRLIYCSLSGFGQAEGESPGYDLLIQGMSGIPVITGPVDGQAFKCGASIADLVSGMNIVQAVLAALYRREKTGEGSIIDVSMLDGQLSLLTYHASAYLNAGQEPIKMGNKHRSIHPFQPYQTSDGLLNVCVGNDRIFARLCKAMGFPEWAFDQRFLTNALRVEHREQLDRLLVPVFLTKSRHQWKQQLASFKVPCGGMLSVPEALENAHLITHEHPNGGSLVHSLKMGFQLNDSPLAAARRAPRLGEHNDEVLAEWLQQS